jgi:glucose-1-phosphate adenylyltransferase
MRNVVAVIMAGGQGERLSVLSSKRAKPAVPFAGKYRIIDFTLSNCVNSGLYKVAVLTQYRPHSLNDHIGLGRPWDLDRTHGGVRILQPFLGRRDSDWYRGTADAVHQNLSFLADWKPDLVLVLSGDHVYKMDYTPMIDFHDDRRADATVAVMQVPVEEAGRFGTMVTDVENRVVRFEEKPPAPSSNLISMGVYVFEYDALLERLEEDAEDPASSHDFGRNVVPRMVESDRVYAYRFDGYWKDVGTIESYWDANMGLLRDPPDFDLYDKDWIIHTRSEERPPAKIAERATVSRSLVSHGCCVIGNVEHSVLSPGVFVYEGAVVRDSIIMMDSVIEQGAVLDRVIVDKEVVVGSGCQIGVADGERVNRRFPRHLNTGLTVIGKRARIPGGYRIGRNCLIGSDAHEVDFPSEDGLVVPSGETIERATREGRGERATASGSSVVERAARHERTATS